jgi:hypothetical protein
LISASGTQISIQQAERLHAAHYSTGHLIIWAALHFYLYKMGVEYQWGECGNGTLPSFVGHLMRVPVGHAHQTTNFILLGLSLTAL